MDEHELVGSPGWFPLRLELDDSMRLVRLDEAAYRTVSFLDDRLLAVERQQAVSKIATISAAAVRLAPRAHYVFHTGHVGSTLVSRLIGAHGDFFSLREPALLRLFAHDPSLKLGATGGDPLSLQGVLAILSRTWQQRQRAVIKVTSIANDAARFILAGDDQPHAIFMFVAPLAYLRGILGGPNSRVEARTLAPLRWRRLLTHLGGSEAVSGPNSEGEWIAMSWLCEMAALHRAAQGVGARVLWVNFDGLLRDPVSGMLAIFRALGAAPTLREVDQLVHGPLMRQYSKAPEHAYDAALRVEVLRAADEEHGAEIMRGMEWLGAMARRDPRVSAVVESTLRMG